MHIRANVLNKPGTIRTVAGTKSARQLAAMNQKAQFARRFSFEETPQQREIREWNERVEAQRKK